MSERWFIFDGRGRKRQTAMMMVGEKKREGREKVIVVDLLLVHASCLSGVGDEAS